MLKISLFYFSGLILILHFIRSENPGLGINLLLFYQNNNNYTNHLTYVYRHFLEKKSNFLNNF